MYVQPPSAGRTLSVCLDRIYLRHNWGQFENVAILVAIAVNEGGYSELFDTSEITKHDKIIYVNFYYLCDYILDGFELEIGDKYLSILQAMAVPYIFTAIYSPLRLTLS